MDSTHVQEEAVAHVGVYVDQLTELQSYGLTLKTACTRLRALDSVLQAIEIDVLIRRVRYLQYNKKRLPPQIRCPELDALLNLGYIPQVTPTKSQTVISPSTATAKSQAQTAIPSHPLRRRSGFSEAEIRESAKALGFTDRELALVLNGLPSPATSEQRREISELRKRIKEYLADVDADSTL